MHEGDLSVGLIVSAVLAFAVIFGAVWGVLGRWRNGPLVILLIGGGIDWLQGTVIMLIREPALFVNQFDLSRQPQVRLYFWVAGSLFWLLLYYGLRSVRLEGWVERLVALVVVNFATIVYFTAVGVAQSQVLGTGPAISFPWLSIGSQLGGMITSGYGYESLAICALQIWLVSTWLKRGGSAVGAAGNSVAVGSKGVFMSTLSDQSTRLLCASVLLDHGGARKKLLGWLKDDHRAVALELGVDLRLAAQLARFAEKRRRRSWWIYFGIFCASLLASLVSPVGWIIGGIAAAIFWFFHHVEEHEKFAPLFLPESFKPEVLEKMFPAELEANDLSSLPVPEQNFFVYAGFTPFVGAGQDLGGWSVVIALDKPSMNFGSAATIKPFEIRDVYAAIDKGLESLSVNEVQKLDCYFACGTDVRGNPNFLPDILGRPVRQLSDEVAAQYKYADDAKVRHYRSYRIVDWGGELALSYYIRCARRGKTLFVETKRYILTPLGPDYRAVDKLVPMRAQEKIGTMVGALVAGPLQVVVSPLWVVAEGARVFAEVTGTSEEKKQRKLIERSPLFNYGAATSLRELLSSGAYGHYFQKMDGDLYNKLFEHEVLDSLVEFLDSHGIDSSDLKERQSMILNNGVMVQSGNVNAESLAVGTAARAVKKVQGAFGGAAAGKVGAA